MLRSLSDSELSLSIQSLNDCDNNNDKKQFNIKFKYNSWPQLITYDDDDDDDDDDLEPPNYHQICVADLISLNKSKNIGNKKSIELNKNNKNKNLTIKNEIEQLRRENFLLTSIILKNNDDIKLLQQQQQRLNQSIKEFINDFNKLEKLSMNNDECIQLNMKEIKLINDDFELLKRMVKKLQYKLTNLTSASNTTSTNTSTNSTSTGSSTPTSPLNFDSIISPLSIHNHNEKLNKRIDELELKLQKLLQQNYNLNIEFERNIRHINENESDLNQRFEQRLQYVVDMNQLLQLKLNMLESKFFEKNNNVMDDPRYNYIASKLAYDQLSTSTLTSIFSNNQKSVTLSMDNPMNKNIAYVVPNVRQLQHQQSLQPPPQQQLQPSTSTSTFQRSISETNSSDNNSEQQRQQHHSRRCRKHHRIRLFPHKRRH